MYIIFEGNECCGKSSHAKSAKKYLESRLCISNIIYREAPDKTNPYGNLARDLLKRPYSNVNNISISIASLMSEAFNSHELTQENIVIQTRSILSTLVYSELGCCLDTDISNAILELVPLFTPPDILFLMDCSLETIERRLAQRLADKTSALDVYESINFIKKIDCKYKLFTNTLSAIWKTQTKFIKVNSDADFYSTQSFIRQEINNYYGL